MLLRTFEKISELFEASYGYLTTGELKSEKITTVQINELVKSGHVERITHGVYWWVDKKNGKPENYKMIETAKANKNVIVCMESALYFYGITEDEPAALSVATSRTDRSAMKMNFNVSRHYFPENLFNKYYRTISTKYGDFKIYSPDRSLCDYIRINRGNPNNGIEKIISAYSSYDAKNISELMKYAEEANLSKSEKYMLSEIK